MKFHITRLYPFGGIRHYLNSIMLVPGEGYSPQFYPVSLFNLKDAASETVKNIAKTYNWFAENKKEQPFLLQIVGDLVNNFLQMILAIPVCIIDLILFFILDTIGLALNLSKALLLDTITISIALLSNIIAFAICVPVALGEGGCYLAQIFCNNDEEERPPAGGDLEMGSAPSTVYYTPTHGGRGQEMSSQAAWGLDEEEPGLFASFYNWCCRPQKEMYTLSNEQKRPKTRSYTERNN